MMRSFSHGATFALVFAWGCGNQAARNSLLGGDDSGDTGETGSSDAEPPTYDGMAGAFSAPDGDASSAGVCVTCSADLHQVLDCTTHDVVQTCPATAGCAPGGTCVAPCDSAAANRSSVGCDYYPLNPDAESPVPDDPNPGNDQSGGCYAVIVANTWSTPVILGLEFDGQSLDASTSAYVPSGSGGALTYTPLVGGQLAPDQLAIIFLAQHNNSRQSSVACPSSVHVAYTANDAAIHGTGRGHAFHLMTSAPVVAYDVYPYGGAVSEIASSSLLLPTSAWDTNYVAVGAYAGEPDLPADMNISFVASQDHTTLTINPPVAIGGGPGVAAGPQGMPSTYTLNRGESIQFEQLEDLSGSFVLADKPIGAWGGHWGMFVPDMVPGVDAAHQQLPPVNAWGSEYVAVRYRNRVAGQPEETVPWRLAGAAQGTTLTYAPQPPAGAPLTLAPGQVVEFNSPGPFVVSSQDEAHPFYLAAHMTGESMANGLGDPETVNVLPAAQYLDHYVFFTDPTYAETNLVVVRSAISGADVTLDCIVGPLTGWEPVDGRYEYTRVDVQHFGTKVGSCDNGRHEMKSATPFGVTVWGFDNDVSYAFPAGGSVKPINAVIVSPVVPR